MATYYSNYQEFLIDMPELALELAAAVGGVAGWETEELTLYNNLAEFAEYELTEGWYVDLGLERDYHGAPHPLDFIDFDAFGVALADSWDASSHFLGAAGNVITTSYGW